MSDKTLISQTREQSGKGYSRAIRRDGKVPGVYYFKGQDAVPLIVEEKALLGVIASKPALINLQFEDGKSKEVIIREIQRDPVTETIQHIDFMGIKRGVKITVTVPVQLVGEAAGVKQGGIVESLLREVEIECLPKHLPEQIEIDISHLEIGDSLHIRDLELENIKILTLAERGIVNVILPKVAAAAVEVEEEVEEEAEKAEEPDAAEKETE